MRFLLRVLGKSCCNTKEREGGGGANDLRSVTLQFFRQLVFLLLFFLPPLTATKAYTYSFIHFDVTINH